MEVFVYTETPELKKEIEEKKPSAILLDIFLKNTSGIDTLKEIKEIDRQIPVIMMTGHAEDDKRLESLRNGAYSLLTKPFRNLEELYHIVNNSMEHYLETLRAKKLASEIEERYRREKMNIRELDFLKSLHHMIGETEDPLFVFKNAYTLLQNFLHFDYFGTLLANKDEIGIQIFPGDDKDRESLRKMASVLIGGMLEKERGHGQRIVVQGVAEDLMPVDNSGLETVIAELSTGNRNYGYAALYRGQSFNDQERSIFHRFCSHIALTIEKIGLFNEIKMLSIHDGLTGVYNHAYVVGELENEVERSKRFGTRFSVILFDIDDFKFINDTHGHLAGDYVLKIITRAMKENLRTIDTIGRYGGEEFLLILPQTDADRGGMVAERLRKAVETAIIEYEGSRISTTVSGGIASYIKGIEAKDIIKKADDNLYQAKRSGKNRTYYENF